MSRAGFRATWAVAVITAVTLAASYPAAACGAELVTLMGNPFAWGPHEERTVQVVHSADLPGKPMNDRETSETVVRRAAPDRIHWIGISHGSRAEGIVIGPDTWWQPHDGAWGKIDDDRRRRDIVDRPDHLAKNSANLVCRRARRPDGLVALEYEGEVKGNITMSLSGTVVFDEALMRPLRDDLVLTAQGWPIRMEISFEFRYDASLDIQPPPQTALPRK